MSWFYRGRSPPMIQLPLPHSSAPASWLPIWCYCFCHLASRWLSFCYKRGSFSVAAVHAKVNEGTAPGNHSAALETETRMARQLVQWHWAECSEEFTSFSLQSALPTQLHFSWDKEEIKRSHKQVRKLQGSGILSRTAFENPFWKTNRELTRKREGMPNGGNILGMCVNSNFSVSWQQEDSTG